MSDKLLLLLLSTTLCLIEVLFISHVAVSKLAMSKHISNLFLVLIRSFYCLLVLLPMVASLAVAKADSKS